MGCSRDVIVIGGSAGAIDALLRIVAPLPEDIGAMLLVVVHVPATRVSALPAILSRGGRVPARHPVDGERAEQGVIYVAPPDFHLLVRGDSLRLVRGPVVNGVRPAIDPLFQSAAASYGRRVLGVVLSGNLADGAAGSATICAAGGMVLVQDRDEASYASMPLETIARVPPAIMLPSAGIADYIVRQLGMPMGARYARASRREGRGID